jgi:hypothetical protein
LPEGQITLLFALPSEPPELIRAEQVGAKYAKPTKGRIENKPREMAVSLLLVSSHRARVAPRRLKDRKVTEAKNSGKDVKFDEKHKKLNRRR